MALKANVNFIMWRCEHLIFSIHYFFIPGRRTGSVARAGSIQQGFSF